MNRLTLFAVVTVAAFAPSDNYAEEVIAIGARWAQAKAVLTESGFEVDAKKYGLQLAAPDGGLELDFCRLDDETTLVVGVDRDTGKVAALHVALSGAVTEKSRLTVLRRVIKMGILTDGEFSLTFRRTAPSSAAP